MEHNHQAESPWHTGELAAQERVGVKERMAGVGAKVIRDYMPDQHREFFAALPMLIIAATDREERLNAGLITKLFRLLHRYILAPVMLLLETQHLPDFSIGKQGFVFIQFTGDRHTGEKPFGQFPAGNNRAVGIVTRIKNLEAEAVLFQA